MGQTFTDENGRFFVTGRTYELTTIEPVLKFYHKCSDGFPCNRRWKLALPRNKITRPTKSLAIDDPSIRQELYVNNVDDSTDLCDFSIWKHKSFDSR
uniref:Uncharacterized protein n=1 Tax=Romanomermis culicivorax TaxID=13658 RepID=A0A915J6A4_ROMCU